MFKLKIFFTFFIALTFIPLASVSAFSAVDVLGDRDEVIEKLEEEGVSKEGYHTHEIENHMEAYDWLVENAKNEEILLYALEKWEDNYVMVKYSYERQEEAYEWLQKETDFDEVMATVAEDPGYDDKRDYDLIKLVYEKDAEAPSIIRLYLFEWISLLVFNFLFFLFFLKDIVSGKCSVWKWFLAIVLAGPLGVVSYLTFRTPKEEGKERNTGYRLSRYFLIWWNIYLSALFPFIILLSLIVSLFDPFTDFEHIGEFIFWLIVIFAVFVIPVLMILPSTVAYILMHATKKESQRDT